MEVIKRYTPEEAEYLRQDYIKRFILSSIWMVFRAYPDVKSIALVLGEFEAPEREDLPIHMHLILSSEENPDIQAWFLECEDEWTGRLSYSGQANWFIGGRPAAQKAGFKFDQDGAPIFSESRSRLDSTWIDYSDPMYFGVSHFMLAPLFSAFCKDGGHVEAPPSQNFAPYAVIRRQVSQRKRTKKQIQDNLGLVVDIVGTQFRPWLDGVMLTNEDKILKKYTAAQTEELRTKFLQEEVVPLIRTVFEDYSKYQEAILLVAQYWDDEAGDAVHPEILLSDKANCDYQNWFKNLYDNGEFVFIGGLDQKIEDLFDNFRWHGLTGWQENYECIPLFAAFCKEARSQDDDVEDTYLPYAIFRRGPYNSVTTEVVGKMIRPWLDGVMPEWEARK